MKREITENQPNSPRPGTHTKLQLENKQEIIYMLLPKVAGLGDDSPHQLGTLSVQQLRKRRQLPPIGLFRILGVSNEHSKGKV